MLYITNHSGLDRRREMVIGDKSDLVQEMVSLCLGLMALVGREEFDG